MKDINRENILQVFPFLGESPKNMIRKIMKFARPIEFSQGSLLYSDGDACPGIGLLWEGEIRVFKIGESGREITLYEIFPGETCILNAACILSKKNYPANAMALTSGRMLHILDSVFLDLMGNFSQMRDFIFGLFSQRLSEIMELVEEITFRRQDVRLIEYLIEKSANNELQTTHQTIANDLGTSREVISRILKNLEHQKRVVLSRGLIRLINL